MKATQLQPFQKEFLQDVQVTLHKDWNPLGGDDVPRDEYDTYALQVFGVFFNHIFSYEEGFPPSYSSQYVEVLNESIEKIREFLYQIETVNMGLAGDMNHCEIIAGKIKEVYQKYKFNIDLHRISLYLDKTINNQKKQIKKQNPDFSWLKGRCEPSLLAIKSFVEDLLKIDWQRYNIDQKESYIVESGDPIGEGGLLIVYIKHANKNLKTYNYNNKKGEEVFMEFILADEATITYPGGHSHVDYYDYTNGKYIPNNETISLIQEIFENETKIRYAFRGKNMIESGIYDEKNQRYWMTSQIVPYLSPIYWIRKLLGKLEEEKEVIVIVNWKI